MLLKLSRLLVLTICFALSAFAVQAKPHSKTTHTLYMNIWDHYEGKNSVFIDWIQAQEHHIKYIQPNLNVTQAQISEFKKVFPAFSQLTRDQTFNSMQKHRIWQTPYHIIRHNEQILFSGDDQQLLDYLSSKKQLSTHQIKAFQKRLMSKSLTTFTQQPSITPITLGDSAIDFKLSTTTMENYHLKEHIKSLKAEHHLAIVFLDSLCPMPHFPDCERQLAKLNKIQYDQNTLFVAVVNGFYVDENHVNQFIQKHRLTMPVIWDKHNRIFKQYGVFETPLKISINPQGEIIQRGAI